MDYFNKWPEAYAIPDQEAESMADALVEERIHTQRPGQEKAEALPLWTNGVG